MEATAEMRAGRNADRLTRIPRDRFLLSAPFESPAGEAEQRLLQIWEDVLDAQGLGVLDDFFELGGDSFSATALIGEVDRLFGRVLSPSILLKHPTIRSLAFHLGRERGGSRNDCLVPIRTSGDQPPLFVVHAARGIVLFVRRLLPYLDPQQPVYAFQGRGLVDGEVPHCRFEPMAAEYVEALRTVQPRGPYLLAGYCVGGLIAIEMAKKLKAAGEEIRFLGMIDPSLHPCVTPWLRWANPDTLSARLQRTLSRIAWHAKRRRLDFARRTLMGNGPILPDTKPEDLRRQLAVEAGARAALKAYRPAPYDGRVTIFFSAEHRADFAANAGRTDALASRIDIIELGVLHEHLFNTEIGAVGRELQHQLDLLAEDAGDTLAA